DCAKLMLRKFVHFVKKGVDISPTPVLGFNRTVQRGNDVVRTGICATDQAVDYAAGGCAITFDLCTHYALLAFKRFHVAVGLRTEWIQLYGMDTSRLDPWGSAGERRSTLDRCCVDGAGLAPGRMPDGGSRYTARKGTVERPGVVKGLEGVGDG